MEPDVRSEFTDFEREGAHAKCEKCRLNRRLVRVCGVAYMHNAADEIGGYVPCGARHLYQEIVRNR